MYIIFSGYRKWRAYRDGRWLTSIFGWNWLTDDSKPEWLSSVNPWGLDGRSHNMLVFFHHGTWLKNSASFRRVFRRGQMENSWKIQVSMDGSSNIWCKIPFIEPIERLPVIGSVFLLAHQNIWNQRAPVARSQVKNFLAHVCHMEMYLQGPSRRGSPKDS